MKHISMQFKAVQKLESRVKFERAQEHIKSRRYDDRCNEIMTIMKDSI